MNTFFLKDYTEPQSAIPSLHFEHKKYTSLFMKSKLYKLIGEIIEITREKVEQER